MNIEVGKTCYFYEEKACDNVCKAHILHVLPHPEDEDNKLVVYRWYGKHRQHWWYGITDIKMQQLWEEYVQKRIRRRKEERKNRRL